MSNSIDSFQVPRHDEYNDYGQLKAQQSARVNLKLSKST
jgi:hypothetical protein